MPMTKPMMCIGPKEDLVFNVVAERRVVPFLLEWKTVQ